ncbi:AAA domain-containing protein [Hirsutella rhossiliensis]|uniref:AAA domain-containing protein n=1 Tax=Hirsutella rhossiliensis TaxID=111463 RepID=A0A9P8MV77_9HYPO|nr:AAA domain-containing protein [Hirsutella rhossiliensis]KAH0961764.1 AAA domain-containing protein [Hirsutella rhossiliensis]
MGGDVGVAQEVIKLLADEAGLSFIKDVSDRHLAVASTAASGTSFWTTEIKPLFELITHHRVVDSAVLEHEVAALFNYLLGVGGARMARLFGYIAQLVQSWPASSPEASRMAALELSLAVLSKILDCNTTNIVNEAFSTLASLFSKCLDGETTQPEDEFSRLQASKYLDYMRRRLEVGAGITEWQAITQVGAHREQFVLSRDLPGRLSAQGARHDNDHAEIHEIKILPTFDEIMALRGEYLPTTDCSQWHIKGIRGRLDREFRLVREDTVGQLRDAVRQAFEYLRTPNSRRADNPRDGVRTYTYGNAVPIDATFDRFCGLELIVRCSQPAPVQRLDLKGRKDWWTQSKRLQPGALVCAINAFGSVLFCVVSSSTMRTTDDEKARQNKAKDFEDDLSASVASHKAHTLSDDPEYLHVKLQLIDAGHLEVKFPGVILASFKHTLEGLQQMYRKPDLPFSGILAPSHDESPEIDIQPPMYARKPGFSFDLACLSHDNAAFAVSAFTPTDPEEVASRSTLDLTQSIALLNTLQRELSLIQGPPGTGKSYTGEKIIKVLLANKKQTQIGPILCVCYTNHALDQLLEHLLDDGVDKVIRIGSRSKSERLEDLNLRAVAGKMDRTKSEKSGLYHMALSIKDIVQQTKGLLKQLSQSGSWRTVKAFLSENHPTQHVELFGKAEDGFEVVIHHPERVVDQWLAGGARDSRQPRELRVLKEARLMSMSRAERRAIHGDWLKSIREPVISKIGKIHEQYTEAAEKQARVRSDADLRCLQQAAVVGVTTTGLARKLDLLRRLRCKVMLCEEAGEVLEAHVLTALLPSLEHVVLIGDHKQLRPQIQNYELQSTNPRGAQYSLDMSLFERLVQPTHPSDPRISFSVLETQRRMHPDISKLVRSTLYPCLKDAEAVAKYPKVIGLRERLFWLHHEELEGAAASRDPLNTSHTNEFEVEMTAALVSHLVRQGEYSQGDIAVITPYLGQLHRLRHRMGSMFEICLNERDAEELDTLEAENLSAQMALRSLVKKSTLLKSVRVATVDNFQGEEAKVIVISLVRSNPQGKCGFLSTSNRINVLLSRAQHGMYILGNSDTYKSVPMWSDVIKMLQTSSRLGRVLELQCPRHPDARLAVSHPDHFLQFSPESGCILPCDKRLYCGHSCLGRCHSDALHNAVKCLEKRCEKIMDCGHQCPSLCGEPCPGAMYCQKCASPEVKSTCVDLIEMKEYGEIDLDDEPCIFPDCGHFLTVSSMDGQMDMPAHYGMDADGLPTEIKGLSEPFSMTDVGIKLVSGRLPLLSYLKRLINSYAKQVRKEEQPFHRVADLFWHANRQHKTQKKFLYDESVTQVGGSLVAARLLLKCDIIVLSDLLELRKKGQGIQAAIELDLSAHRMDCQDLIKLARKAVRPKEEVQGHVFAAQFCGLCIALDSRPRANGIEDMVDTDSATKGLREEALNHVAEARALLEKYKSTAGLKDEVDAAEAMLNDGVYRPVTADEIRAVHQAMAQEFRGTGHWYTCVNGHPFTIGECGMPMELARCTECDAPIGGQNHLSVEGVRRADEIEHLTGGIDRMGL